MDDRILKVYHPCGHENYLNYQDDGISIEIREWLDDKVEEMRLIDCPGCIAKSLLMERLSEYKEPCLKELRRTKQLIFTF